MKIYQLLILAGMLFSTAACNISPSSPGGKLGSKSYNGSYTLGASSGSAYVYLNATGDNTTDLRYDLDISNAVQLNNVQLEEASGYYSLTLQTPMDTLNGTLGTDFQHLSFAYHNSGTHLNFSGTRIQ